MDFFSLMKFFHCLFPFLLFGAGAVFSQEKDSASVSFEEVFFLSLNMKNAIFGSYLPSREGKTSKVFRIHYDAPPKDGFAGLEAYFELKYDSLKNNLCIDSTAFMVHKDYDEDGISDLILQDVDRNGTLETVIWKKGTLLYHKDKVKLGGIKNE